MPFILTIHNIDTTVPLVWPTKQEDKAIASDPDTSDLLGYSSAISEDGTTVVVGAPFKDNGGSSQGAAYVFTRSSGSPVWNQQDKLVASDLQDDDQFGWFVAVSDDGDTAIVGAPLEDTGGADAGSAYVFTRSGGTWTQQQKIQSSDIAAGDNFGQSVAISSDGNTAIVGAHLEDAGGSDAGAAYVFTRSGGTWTQQQKITAGDAEAGDQFGFSVSISNNGNTAIVGANMEDTGGSNAGAAYIFTRSGGTWTQQQKIQSSDIAAADQFGDAVSVSGDGDTVAVGATKEDAGGSDAGAAYVFTRSGGTWTQQEKLAGEAASDIFGFSVSLSDNGNVLIIGAYGNDDGAANGGAAYIFTRSDGTWTQQEKFFSNDIENFDRFGFSVAISGDGTTAVVGSELEDEGASGAGAIYIFVP